MTAEQMRRLQTDPGIERPSMASSTESRLRRVRLAGARGRGARAVPRQKDRRLELQVRRRRQKKRREPFSNKPAKRERRPPRARRRRRPPRLSAASESKREA